MNGVHYTQHIDDIIQEMRSEAKHNPNLMFSTKILDNNKIQLVRHDSGDISITVIPYSKDV